jgi:uncharacterized membrane protein YdbT with pleckstrin-like domain
MSYVQANLQPGETVDHQGRMSWFYALRRAFFYVALALVFKGFGVEYLPTLLVLIALVSTIRGVILVQTSEYVVTDRRVIGKYGLIRRQSVDVMMTAIAGVSIVNTFVGRICGYGTVWVNGSGARRALIAVQNPKAFSQAVYARLDDSKLTKGTAAYTLNVQQAQTAAQPAYGMAPGWYPDQRDLNLLRYFDGNVWTSKTSRIEGPEITEIRGPRAV